MEKQNKIKELPLTSMILAALFTALMIVGAYISIPFVNNVPFVLANFFVWLSGLILGPIWGGISVLLYLILGALGLPVFAGARGGLAVFIGPEGPGPTSGFLLGYLLSAIIIGLLADRQGKSIIRNFLAMLAGFIVTYAVGIPIYSIASGNHDYLAIVVSFTWILVGDGIKIVAAVAITKALSKFTKMHWGVISTPEGKKR